MWFLFALTAAWVQASHRLLNQYRQVPGLELAFVVKALIMSVTIPFLFLIPWPQNPVFYIATAATGVIAVYQDKSFFDFTARFGAGAVTRFEPLSVPLAFALWTLLHPALLDAYLSNLPYFAGICACIASSVYFARHLRICVVNRAAMNAMFPLIFTLAAMTMLTKTAIDAAPEIHSVIVYVFIQSSVVVLLSGLWNRARGGVPLTLLRDPHFRKTALLAAGLVLSVMVLRVFAMRLVANPAYVTAVMLTGPFWVMLFYRLVKHKEEGDIKSGIFIVLSALALTALVAASGL